MARLVVTGPARADVREILSELRDVAGLQVAERYLDSFETVYRYIAEFPASGSPRPTLGAGIRIHVVSPFLVIYRDDQSTVSIIRVVDGRRNVTSELLRR